MLGWCVAACNSGWELCPSAESCLSIFGQQLCSAVAPVPHVRRPERLLRRRLGGVARLPCRYRHLVDRHRFRCAGSCCWTQIVEGLAWDGAPVPPLGAPFARISGHGRRCTEVCVGLATGSPLSRGVSRCRSAHPRHRYLHNSCCIRGAILLH